MNGDAVADPDALSLARVSVLIPHLDDLDRLDLCLRCLDRQTLPRERYEIIVCDNGSAVGPDAVRQRVGNRARVVFETVRGAAAARNHAGEQATGAVLAFTDSDCQPAPDWIERGVAGLEEFDVVGGAIQVFVADPANMTPTEAFEMVFAFRNSKYVRRNGFSVTATLFTTKTVFGEVGGFRQGVSEDIEWCRRAVEKRFRLGYREDCVIRHPARKSLDELKAKWSRMVVQTYLLARSRNGSVWRWVLHHWIVLASILPHLLVIAVTPKLPRLRDKLRAAEALIRIRLFRFTLSHKILFGRVPL